MGTHKMTRRKATAKPARKAPAKTAKVAKPAPSKPVKAVAPLKRAQRAMAPAKRPKGGNNRVAAEQRRVLFVERWLINGHNGVDAAEFAGFIGSRKVLSTQASNLLKEPAVRAAIDARSRKVSEAAEMTTENWAREVRALAFFRVGELYDAEGCLIPIHLLPDHVQAAIASFEVITDVRDTETAAGATTSRTINTTRIRPAEKTGALGLMARHLGLFEKDNTQVRENVRVVVELVG
jgi:hypothetical protein